MAESNETAGHCRTEIGPQGPRTGREGVGDLEFVRKTLSPKQDASTN